MAKARIKLNSAGIQSYLDGGGGVDALLQAEAEERAARARANAPVASGAYRDSIHVETDHTDRMVKRVVADVPYAMVVEANTGTMARSL
jgi:hypothetical protein